jgi:hypothetical protein
MSAEEWRPVVGNTNYEVSSLGRVRMLPLKNELPLKLNKGYVYVYLRVPDKLYTGVHRLVAAAFLPRSLCDTEVNHKDGIKCHNKFDNLEWCTPRENVRHAHKMGLMKRSARVLLTERDIPEIYRLHLSGMSNGAIGKIYGVHNATISSIVTRRTWADVTPKPAQGCSSGP